MDSNLLVLAHQLIEQLQQFQLLPDESEERRTSSLFWQQQLEALLDSAEHPTVSIVFIGKVGVGKSSIVSSISRLLIGEKPTSKQALSERLVMATGSGRTTVCEVVVQRSNEGGAPLALTLEPMPMDELEREIRIFASDEWKRRRSDARRLDEDGSASSQEMQRAIRGLTDYEERVEESKDGNLRRRRIVRPLEEAIAKFATEEEFSRHLIERARIADRTRTEWSWSENNDSTREALKSVFFALNNGSNTEALLPNRLILRIEGLLAEHAHNTNIRLVDTRGLDGGPASRRDLLDILRDSSAHYMLCSSFNSAPDEELRQLLSLQRESTELSDSIDRTTVLIIDQDQAIGVTEAGRDRHIGQEFREEQCWQVIEKLVDSTDFRERIISYDLLQDSEDRLMGLIRSSIDRHHQRLALQFEQCVENTQRFLQVEKSEECSARRYEIDAHIHQVISAAIPQGIPVEFPMQGVLGALENARHVSKVYASCRRAGRYRDLDVYTSLHNFVSQSASLWLKGFVSTYQQALVQLRSESRFAMVHDHILLRELQVRDGSRKLVGDYADRITEEFYKALTTSAPSEEFIWHRCSAEWGLGTGFKQRIVELLRTWYQQRQELFHQHEQFDLSVFIPLVDEASRPLEAPRFVIHVSNFRRLVSASWNPEPVSLLIGANGSGKSSLLLVLRLMRVAYEKGIPEAVRIVMGGSHNLKSWESSDDAAIELGLDLGEICWRVQLIPSNGAADYQTSEMLKVNERVVFSRDVLGNFMHNGERIPPTQSLGIRALIDRGVFEPSVRRMALLLQNIQVFHDPDLWTLRWQGSQATDDRQVQARGTNALAVLRRWFQERDQRYRFDWVVEGLRAAFPASVQDIDFLQADNTLVTRVYRPNSDVPTPLSAEANGVLHLLIYLVQLAGVEEGSLVAFDEPENGLHPYALRVLLRRTQRWAARRHLTVILATHSLVLLNELNGHPEQVFVTTRERGASVSFPARLPDIRDEEWLSDFLLGQLYEQGEYGSNEEMLPV